MPDIILTTINAKWIHPSLALRLLKANLGDLEDRCEIMEFALRQPLSEKLEPLLSASPVILGISVSIWNHLATVELLGELEEISRKGAKDAKGRRGEEGFRICRPIVVLGGPEVSFLSEDAEIFKYADFVIRGEGEVAFRELCKKILSSSDAMPQASLKTNFIDAQDVDINAIKTAYHLYTDEDIQKKLIYVESSRGCPFTCEFCLSSAKKTSSLPLLRASSSSASPREPSSPSPSSSASSAPLREIPLEPCLTEIALLISRGVKTFKFLDRSFNTNIKRALSIIEFFLEKLEKNNFVVHFEMVPSIFPQELLDALARFPPGTLRLEIGIQTLNSEVASRIRRPCKPEKEIEALRYLSEKTNAIIHADLIAGLPGEDLASFGRGFDKLWHALCADGKQFEIQLGILKLLPGAPISRHNETFGMRYNPLPPYEVMETSAMGAEDIKRIKNFARFWELIINRGLAKDIETSFENFLKLSDSLLEHFGKNYGIDKQELLEGIRNFTTNHTN